MGEIDWQIEATKAVFQLVGYVPNPTQEPIHADNSRIKEVAGGERGGKSMTDEKELVKHWWVDRAAYKLRDALYWLVGSDYGSCKGEWEYAVTDFTKLEVMGPAPTKNIDPGEIILQDGTRIITKSARYPEKIATEAPDGIIICEAAQVEYEVFLRCLSRLAEKRGWLVMGGTFEEEEYTSWYREYYDLGQSVNELGLKSFSLPSWENFIVFPGGRNDPEILRMESAMTRERFMERFGGVPCPKTGRVVLEFNNAIHVKECPFDPDLPISLAVDPGYGGAHVVLFIQEYAEYIAIIDEIYLQDIVTEDIILVCELKPFWGANANNIVGGAIDIEGKSHHAMKPPIEVWAAKGIALMMKRVFVEDGIDLLRTHLKVHPLTHLPGIIVDPKCRGLISECGGCKSPLQEGGIWMRHKDTQQPLKKNDHACKALIYFLANKYGFVGNRKTPPALKWVGQQPQRTFVRT